MEKCIFTIEKHVKGFPHYTINTEGRARSLARHKYIAVSTTRVGYQSVRFCKKENGEKIHKRFLLHRLVLSSFKGFDKTKPNVDHIDNNPRNNYLSNLRWVTQSENIQKSYDLGRSKTPKTMTGKIGKLHHSSVPIAGYDMTGSEIIRFESISLAKKAGYYMHYTSINGIYKSRGLIFKRLIDA